MIKRTGSEGAIRKSLNTNKQMQMPGDYILSVIYIWQKQIADTSNKSFDNREEAQHLHQPRFETSTRVV